MPKSFQLVTRVVLSPLRVRILVFNCSFQQTSPRPSSFFPSLLDEAPGPWCLLEFHQRRTFICFHSLCYGRRGPAHFFPGLQLTLPIKKKVNFSFLGVSQWSVTFLLYFWPDPHTVLSFLWYFPLNWLLKKWLPAVTSIETIICFFNTFYFYGGEIHIT